MTECSYIMTFTMMAHSKCVPSDHECINLLPSRAQIQLQHITQSYFASVEST